MVTLSPGFKSNTYDEHTPGFTSAQPPLARSHGGVAIRIFNMMMFPSAG